jgi:PAS domain-containing protein
LFGGIFRKLCSDRAGDSLKAAPPPLKNAARPSDTLRMAGARKPTSMKPGMRALAACGDGFWECDLLDGSAWFSDWFYQKFGWVRDAKRNTFAALQARMPPMAWLGLMDKIRGHLEQGVILDFEFDVRPAGDALERWRVCGRAHRNEAGQPVYLAGSMRAIDGESHASSALACLRSAFDALPVAAALLDARATLIEANRLWREYPDVTAAQAIARLRAANSQTAIEFWLDPGVAASTGIRALRVRAIAFHHDGARHLVVTLEDRRND